MSHAIGIVMRVPDEFLQMGPAQTDWPHYGLVDDIRPALTALLRDGKRAALVTLIEVDGPSPRPLGSQMLIDAQGNALGYVSGGCVEGSLAILAADIIETGVAQRFVFGADSPFMDVTLLCGTRIDVLIEPASADDDSLRAVVDAFDGRRVHLRQSAPDQNGVSYPQTYLPTTRLIVIGQDPVALACLQVGELAGFECILIRDKGPHEGPDHTTAHYLNKAAPKALAELGLDPWTALVTTTHDLDQDHEALLAGLSSEALYVGALGSKRRLDDRVTKLAAAGLNDTQIARLKAPVGLAIGAATPYEIGVSIIADIIAARRLKAIST